MLTQFVSLLRKHWRLFALQFFWIVCIWLLRNTRDWMIDDHVELKLVVVPADVPVSVPSQTKSGEPMTLRLRESYPRRFVAGWSQCLRRFLLFPTMSRNTLRQLPGIENEYVEEGFADCQQQLAVLSRTYGTRTVRRILLRKYGSDIEAIEQSVGRLKEAT